jgi:beta-catenin-like protein 1
MARLRAPKVLNYAMTGIEGKECCSRFIDMLGLKFIFSMLMQKVIVLCLCAHSITEFIGQ